jgi:hypothetical protein
MLIKIGKFSIDLNYKLLKTLVICAIIFSVIMFHIGVPSITKEGFEVIQEGVDDLEKETKKFVEKFKQSETHLAPEAKLPEGQLFYFTNNKFSPDCCEYSTISSNGGCACITKEQEDFLNSRGNNRSSPNVAQMFKK